MEPQVIRSGTHVYVLRRRLGSGAFGEVFAAVDEGDSVRQPLAIKRLRPGHPEHVTVREAAAAEAAAHAVLQLARSGPQPNIVTIFDAFEFGGDHFIATELCDGSVRDLFAQSGYRGEDWLLPVANGLLNGLQWIHRSGALHNDIHVENVLFLRPPLDAAVAAPGLYTFKVSDFGFGGRWSPPEEGREEDPTLTGSDVVAAARALVDVAHGRACAWMDDTALGGVPHRFRDPIRRAIDGGYDFRRQRVAIDLLEALREA